MALESVTEKLTEFGEQAAENYWKAFDLVSETTDRMTDTFLASVPGLPEESTQWLDGLRTYRQQGLASLKQNVNSFTGATQSFGWPKEQTQKLTDSYKEQVERWFEKVASFQAKGREAVETFAGQLPEPGKQWVNRWNEMTDRGVETWKSVLQGNFDPNDWAAGSSSEAADSNQQSQKKAPKTTAKTKAK